MYRAPAAVLSTAAAVAAALGLSGCADERPAPPQPTGHPIYDSSLPTAPAAAPLPPPDQLTGVIYRLADTSIPAEQKVGLVQYATADDRGSLGNFGEALKANGFVPLTVDATDLTWAGEPGHIFANVTISSSNPGVKPFTFPMDFAPIRNTWQLSKRTADQLLTLGGAPPPR